MVTAGSDNREKDTGETRRKKHLGTPEGRKEGRKASAAAAAAKPA